MQPGVKLRERSRNEKIRSDGYFLAGDFLWIFFGTIVLIFAMAVGFVDVSAFCIDEWQQFQQEPAK